MYDEGRRLTRLLPDVGQLSCFQDLKQLSLVFACIRCPKWTVHSPAVMTLPFLVLWVLCVWLVGLFFVWFGFGFVGWLVWVGFCECVGGFGWVFFFLFLGRGLRD